MGKSEQAQFYDERARETSRYRTGGNSPRPSPDARSDVESQQKETKNETAKKPTNWKHDSVKHRQRFEELLEVWENTPDSITIIGGYGVCFEEVFVIGTGSYGTKVYVCLGCDGIERAMKRLPKSSDRNDEREILTSKNVIKSEQIVNYHFFDEISDKHNDYLILDLYEQNLEEYIKEHKDEMTAFQIRKMIR